MADFDKYDSGAAPYVAATGTGLGAALAKIKYDQHLFNTSGGAQGRNWAADAKALDKALAGYGQEGMKAMEEFITSSNKYAPNRPNLESKIRRNQFDPRYNNRPDIKAKFPKKALALAAAGLTAGIYMRDAAGNVRDAETGNVVGDLINGLKADVMEAASYAPGAASGAIAAYGANKYASDKALSKYDRKGVRGLTPTQAKAQYMRDVGGAIADPFKRMGANVSARLDKGPGAYLRYDDTIRDLDTAKRKRFTDPLEAEYARQDIPAADPEVKAKPGSKQRVIMDNIADNTAGLERARVQTQQQLDDLIDSPTKGGFSFGEEARAQRANRMTQLEGELADLDNRVKSNADLSDKAARMTDANIKTEINNRRVNRKAKNNVAGEFDDYLDYNTAKAAGADVKAATKPVVEDIKAEADGFKEKAKAGMQRGREFVSNTANKVAHGKFSQAAKKAPKSVLTRGIKPAGKVIGATAAPGMVWSGVEGAYNLADAEDKGQYLKNTGTDMLKGLKTTFDDYKTMYDQDEYLPLAGRVVEDMIVDPSVASVKALGNTAMGLGERAGLYDAPTYWDMDRRGFDMVSQRGDLPSDEQYHPSQQSEAVKTTMTAPTKVIPPGQTKEDVQTGSTGSGGAPAQAKAPAPWAKYGRTPVYTAGGTDGNVASFGDSQAAADYGAMGTADANFDKTDTMSWPERRAALANMYGDPGYTARGKEVATIRAQQIARAKAEQERQAQLLATSKGKGTGVGSDPLTAPQQLQFAKAGADNPTVPANAYLQMAKSSDPVQQAEGRKGLQSFMQRQYGDRGIMDIGLEGMYWGDKQRSALGADPSKSGVYRVGNEIKVPDADDPKDPFNVPVAKEHRNYLEYTYPYKK